VTLSFNPIARQEVGDAAQYYDVKALAWASHSSARWSVAARPSWNIQSRAGRSLVGTSSADCAFSVCRALYAPSRCRPRGRDHESETAASLLGWPNLTISRSSDGAIHGSRLHARVLKPLTELDLREDQRVRIIVEAIDEQRPARSGALARLKAGIASMEFSSDRRLPSRDGLYRRS